MHVSVRSSLAQFEACRMVCSIHSEQEIAHDTRLLKLLIALFMGNGAFQVLYCQKYNSQLAVVWECTG